MKKFKKVAKSFLGLILTTTILAMTVSPAFAGGQPSITVVSSKAEAVAGETVDFTVKISGDYQKFRGFSLRVYFPMDKFESLEIREKDSIETIAGLSSNGNIDHFDNVDLSKGFVSYIAYWDNGYDGEVNGTLFKIRAKLKSNASTGDANIYISDNIEHTSYANSDYESKQFVLNNPSLLVKANSNSGSGSGDGSGGFNGSGSGSSGSGSSSSGSSGSETSSSALSGDDDAGIITEELIQKNRKNLKTSKDRLRDTVIMEINNYAATVDGGLCHIYKGEKVAPFIDKQGRTMIPVRFVGEALGALVKWDAPTRQVTISLDDKVVVMTLGSKVFTLNGVKKEMDTTAKLVDSRTMVPVRFVAESLGKAVKWDGKNRLVIISEPAYPWFLEEELEKKASEDVKLLLSPMIRDLIETEVKK